MDEKLNADERHVFSNAKSNKNTVAHPPCETGMVTFLTETVNKPAFAARFNQMPGAVEQLRGPKWREMWNRVLNSPSHATQSDLAFVFRVFNDSVDRSLSSSFGGNYTETRRNRLAEMPERCR